MTLVVQDNDTEVIIEETNDTSQLEIEDDTNGELLLCQIRRHCSKPNHDWQHNSIFCTRVVCYGLHCSLIINDGSSKNSVSKAFVQCLGLEKTHCQILFDFMVTSWR